MNYLRTLMTYILPLALAGYVVLCGLWIVPDTLFGMYGNIDGKWGSWNARAILEWSSFLDFGPYSPLTSTGSLFLPNLPWLNPGAMALAIPASIEYKYLFSYLVYLIELTVPMYLLFTELEIKREYAFMAVLLYISFFFIPFIVISGVPSFYALGPFYCHQAAAMNLSTVALLRCGRSTFRISLVWGLVFIVCLFSAFASGPISNFIFVPVYALLWATVFFSNQADRRAIPFRLGLILFTFVLFSIVGLPSYILATAGVSARDNNVPPFLHAGMALLTIDYWISLISRFTTCSAEQGQFLICTSKTPVAWFQIAALIGGSIMIAFDKGRRRALAITVLGMIVFLHFYFLIGMEYTLGPVHILGYNYLYWPLFPFIFAVVVAASAMIVGSVLRKHGSIARWIPAFANTGIAIVGLVIFINVIYVRQPRMAGEGIFGLRPIAHYPVHKGDIHRYLEDHVALSPGKEFRGYVTLYLGADDSVVRKRYPTSNGAMAHATYVHARDVLSTQFGNMFQLTDLWNSNIPTLDDYGQWLTKQMYMFNSDLLAQPGDALDPTGVATHLYKFVPELLAKLGVRYVISDGTLNNPLVTEVAHETSKEGMTVRLYEIRNTNLGNLSPTKVVIADSYDDAVLDLQKSPDAAILLGSTTLPSDLVPADQVRLTVMKGGYHITAESAGTSLLVLPVQFSHCWKLVGEPGSKAGLFRANIVQTGIYFQGKIDADLRFEFGVTNSSCRKRDGGDMRNYSSTSRSKMYQFF